MIAAGVAFSVGVPLLACSGAADTSTDGAAPPADAPKEEKKAEKKGIGDALHSTWKVKPGADTLRQLKIINAAIEDKPVPKNLGDLSGPEQQLYNDAKKASGADQQYYRGLIAMLKGARVTFESNGKGKYQFDGGDNPFSYTTSNVTDKSLDIVITYDHGVVEKANMKLEGANIEVHFTAPQTADFTFSPQ